MKFVFTRMISAAVSATMKHVAASARMKSVVKSAAVSIRMRHLKRIAVIMAPTLGACLFVVQCTPSHLDSSFSTKYPVGSNNPRKGAGRQTNPASAPAQFKHGVSNLGAISAFQIPAGWQLQSYEDDATGYAYVWNHPANSDVTLSVCYRVPPMSPDSAERIQAILNAPPHDLEATEVRQLVPLIRELADQETFASNSALTKDISGSRVICIRGTYKDQPVQIERLYINASGDGRVMQELSYIAPSESYTKYRKEAQQGFDSLRLK